MAELPTDRMDFHPRDPRQSTQKTPTMRSSTGTIRHLQPVLTSLINTTTTDKILAGLRIHMYPGCEFSAAFRLLLQSQCVECQCVIGGAGEIMGRAVAVGSGYVQCQTNLKHIKKEVTVKSRD